MPAILAKIHALLHILKIQRLINAFSIAPPLPRAIFKLSRALIVAVIPAALAVNIGITLAINAWLIVLPPL